MQEQQDGEREVVLSCVRSSRIYGVIFADPCLAARSTGEAWVPKALSPDVEEGLS